MSENKLSVKPIDGHEFITLLNNEKAKKEA
jgi:hypothetical protein